MKDYYRQRAPVYDRVYAYPERQPDLRYLADYVTSHFEGLEVLEVAAGTGYWTQYLAAVSGGLLATDASEEPLSRLSQRPGCEAVATRVLDAYALGELGRTFTGVFAGLWLSHVPRERLGTFMAQLAVTP